MQKFNENDYIRYGASGVCKIESISVMTSPIDQREAEFYVLKPVSNMATTLYVPVDSPAAANKMSRVLTRDEIDALILSTLGDDVLWQSDRKERNEYFRTVLRNSDQRELLRLISCIYIKRNDLRRDGKRLSSTDEGVLKQAERLIQSDFAFVLGISGDEVGEYVRRILASSGAGEEV